MYIFPMIGRMRDELAGWQSWNDIFSDPQGIHRLPLFLIPPFWFLLLSMFLDFKQFNFLLFQR
jgi:hypothetical protein